VVICLERGADLHTAQLMPLPLTVSCFSKSRLVLPFWYRRTWVVPEKGPLNGCVCVPHTSSLQLVSPQWQLMCKNLHVHDIRSSQKLPMYGINYTVLQKKIYYQTFTIPVVFGTVITVVLKGCVLLASKYAIKKLFNFPPRLFSVHALPWKTVRPRKL